MRKFEAGKRHIYTAKFEGTTLETEILASLSSNPPFPLALLIDVRLGGELVSDHSWYPFWGAFECAEIKNGDPIQFLATPRPYLKRRDDAWDCGLSQVCWVQKAGIEFEPCPVLSPPQTKEEAEWFLSRGMVIASDRGDEPKKYVDKWGARFAQWSDSVPDSINQVIQSGWASFGAWYPNPEFAHVFEPLSDLYSCDRTINQIADIAAWCNLGSAASEHRFQSGLRICSTSELIKFD